MKPEKAVWPVLLALIFLAGFLAGFFIGRNSSGQVRVETAQSRTSGESSGTESTASAPDGSSETVRPRLININSANADDLTALPGIGAVLAQRIVDYRQQHGPFETLEDLSGVEGIGSKRIIELYGYAYCGGTS